MRRSRLVEFLVLISVLIPSFSWGGVNPFDIGFGAKYTALGGAFVALADDSTAVYWNPAGLGLAEKPELKVEGRIKTIGTNLFSAAGMYPVEGQGNVGFNLVYYDSGAADAYDESNVGIGTFSEKRMAGAIGFGYRSDIFCAGVSGFYLIHQMKGDLLDETGNGYGIVLGGMFSPNENIRLGAIFQSKAKLKWDDGLVDEIKPTAKIGFLYSIEGYSAQFRILGDLIQTAGSPMKLGLGVEMIGDQEGMPFSLRAGLADIHVESGESNLTAGELTRLNVKPALGFGFKWLMSSGAAILFDYTVRFEPTGMKHLLSLGYGL